MQEMQEQELGDGHVYVIVSDRVSYIKKLLKRAGKNGRKEKIKCLYIGFNDYKSALKYKEISRYERIFYRPNVPNAKGDVDATATQRSIRTKGTNAEIKIQGDFELDAIQKIADNLERFFPL